MHPKYMRGASGGKTCTNPALHHGRGFPPFHFCGVYSDMRAMFVSKQAFKQVWTLVHVHKLANEENFFVQKFSFKEFIYTGL